MSLKFFVAINPRILASGVKSLLHGSGPALIGAELDNGFSDDVHHLFDDDLDLDTTIGIVRSIGSLSSDEVGTPLEVLGLDLGLEFLVCDQIGNLDNGCEASLNKSKNKTTLRHSPLDVDDDFTCAMALSHAHRDTDLLARVDDIQDKIQPLDCDISVELMLFWKAMYPVLFFRESRHLRNLYARVFLGFLASFSLIPLNTAKEGAIALQFNSSPTIAVNPVFASILILSQPASFPLEQ